MSQYPRIHVWADNEDLLASDLNAEFDNILANSGPLGQDSYSTSVAQMKLQVSPGAQGSESLAASTAGEFERLRFVINRIIGGTYWYDSPAISLLDAYNLLSLGNKIPQNRIVSGRVRTTSNQSLFLVPNGTSNSVMLKATTVNFVCRINGTLTTFVADTTFTGLPLANPVSASETATVNDAAITGQTASLYYGETDAQFPVITMNNVGSSILAQVGRFAAFKHGTEYFLGFVESATTITRCFRGYFTDNLDIPITRTTVMNGDTITLMKLSYVFANTALGLEHTENPPVYAAVAPTSPFSGDYWFDFTVQSWKRYNGSAFVLANATFIGLSVQDSAGCKATRSAELFALYDALNAFSPLDPVSANVIQAFAHGTRISVAGVLLDYGESIPKWTMPTNLAPAVTQTNSTTYYLYVSEKGTLYLDKEKPHSREYDLAGKYHPYQTWRAVAVVFNNGSGQFDATTLFTYGQDFFLPDLSVSTIKIVDKNVTTAKIADAAVTGTQIQTNVALNGPNVQVSGNYVATTSPGEGRPLVVIRGLIAANGSILSGSGFTTGHAGGTGLYTIAFTVAFADGPAIVVSPVTGSNVINAVVADTAPTIMHVQVYSGGVGSDCIFSFIAIGQRA